MAVVVGGSRRNRENARERLNLGARFAYVDCAETAGPLEYPTTPEQPVRMRHVAHWSARLMLTLLVLLNAGTGLVFIGWLLLPEHVPGGGQVGWAGWQLTVARLAFVAIVGVELIRLLQNFAVWVFAFNAKDPVPMDPPIGLRVALLTTIVPSKEPIEVVARTLRRMKDIVYCGEVDVWILDEGDDPDVKAMCRELGVNHFTRKGRPEYNTESGEFRARSKSGNHNSWRAEHELEYDVVAQMDPDHVPMPNFLERTLGYFRDPDIAFVVAPQVYGNMYENWVSHGASVQQYLFSGVVERGGNGLDAPLLIGTNHLYRPAAWRQIGGYQDSIIEDHLTSMRVQAADNPETGHRWKGVYTPDVVAIGEGPTSWADYFNQQKRWAYGIWEILINRSRGMPRGLKMRQRTLYGLVQFYYPSVAISLVLGNLATAMYMFFGAGAVRGTTASTWLALWSASLGSWFLLWFFLRRYNIAEHEREEVGMLGMALALFAGPVYLSAAINAVLRRPLVYVVTAKGNLRTTESLRTFRLHLLWALVGAAMLGVSYYLHRDHLALRVWCGLTVFTGIAPPVIALCSGIRARWRRRGAPEPAVVPELDEAGRELDPADLVDAETEPVPDAEPVPEVPAAPVPVRATAVIPQQRRAPKEEETPTLSIADGEETQRVPQAVEETQRVPQAVEVPGVAPEPEPVAVPRGARRPESAYGTWFEAEPGVTEPEDATRDVARVDSITAVLPAVRLRAPVPPQPPQDDEETTSGGWFSVAPQPTGSGTGAQW
jgi:cellulose synthase (UDP-forming)